jgi:hypothetical protein
MRKSGDQRLDIGNEELGTGNYCPESSIRLHIF